MCQNINTNCTFHNKLKFSHLHPEKESFGTSLELENIDSSCRALVHPLEFAVIREDDKILKQQSHNATPSVHVHF